MKLLSVLFIGLLIGLFPPCGGPALGDPGSGAGEVRELLKRINDFRAEPVKMLKAMGYDPAALEANFPGTGAILEEGLPGFRHSGNLDLAAEKRTDGLLQWIVTGDGAEEKPLEDRYQAAGYFFRSGQEAEAVIAFANYMSPETAAEVFFRDLVSREVAPSEGKTWVLLSRDLEDAGASFRQGTAVVGGRIANVYAVVLSLGSGLAPEEEMFFLRMNQARQAPEETARSLGIETAGPYAAFPPGGLDTLLYSPRLAGTARSHGLDMLRRGYFSTVTPEGETVEERIAAAGYSPDGAAESLALRFHHDQEPDAVEAGESLFRKAFWDEWNSSAPAGAAGVFLGSALSEAGFAFVAGFSEEFQDLCPFCGGDVTVLVADGASREGVPGSFLMAALYEDGDGDGLYGMGEGIPGVNVLIAGPSGEERAFVSGPGGLVTFPVEGPGVHRVGLLDREGLDGAREVEVMDKNVLLFIPLDEEPVGVPQGEAERSP